MCGIALLKFKEYVRHLKKIDKAQFYSVNSHFGLNYYIYKPYTFKIIE